MVNIALVVTYPILEFKINIWQQAISARDLVKSIKYASPFISFSPSDENDHDDFASRIARQDNLCTDL